MIRIVMFRRQIRYACLTPSVVVICLLFFRSGLAAEPAPDYSKQIAPLLSKYCAACHDADAAEGELVLESYADLQKGGKHGPAVLAGDAASSKLYRVLTGQAEPKMPPDKNPAPKAEEIALLKAWIDGGARGPEGAEPERKLLVPKIASLVKQQAVSGLAWSPDGKQLAVAKFGEVALLDAATRQPIRVLGDHPGNVTCVTFSADGKHLLSGSGITGLFGEARLWNLEDGKLERTFRGHRDMIYAVTLNHDGTLLATASYDRRAILWDVATGKQVRTLEGHNDAVYDAAFSPDGKLLATASGDATIKIWSVTTGERFDTLSQPFKEQFAVSFSPDGKYIVAGGVDNRIRVWELVSRDKPQTNPILHARFAHEGAIVRLRYSPDGNVLVSVGDERTIKLWETQTYTQTHNFAPQPDTVHAVAFSPDGGSLAVARMDGSLDVLKVPADAGQRASSTTSSLAVAAVPSELPPMQSVEETEPNDDLKQATILPLPGTATGAIQATQPNHSSDVDLYQIDCRRGTPWVMEINAERSKSPLDSRIEILDSRGQHVVRLLLEAVRDSYINFDGISSDSRDVRLFGWEEMDIGQYVYLQGEICRIMRMPRGPDSGFTLFPGTQTGRHAYFDTTATTHALGDPSYIVQPHPPGTKLIPNGLPVFPLYYENDDDGMRRMGHDSRLVFNAPDDGVYYVRVTDARGFQGPDFKYTLTVRPQRPDFQIKLAAKELEVAPGNGRVFTAQIERIDNFDGPVTVELAGTPPPGFTVSSPLVIEKGMPQAVGVFFAAADAKQPTPEQLEQFKFTATGTIDGQKVVKQIGTLGNIKLGDKPKVIVHLLPDPSQPRNADGNEIVITAGQQVPALLRVERNGFDDLLDLEVNNLPFGVIVANVGLNNVIIRAGETERQIFLEATPWVGETTRLIHAVTEGTRASEPVTLRVVRAKQP